jgi:2-iminobutanoate/2-iminopropanoate deaminase
MVGAGLVFAAGSVGLDPATGSLVEGGAAVEAKRAIANLGAILDAAGSSLDRVLKTTVFLVDMADYSAMNEIYREAFPEPYPARTTVVVHALPLGARVEIECVALTAEAS